MFLITVGNALRRPAPVGCRQYAMRTGGQTITVQWEGDDLSWCETPEGWTLTQELRVGDGNLSDLWRVGIVCSRAGSTITVRVSSCVGLPVYYHESPSGECLLASRVAVLRAAGVPVEADPKALPEFLTYRCVLAPATLFRDIFRVPQGGVLTCSLAGERPALSLELLVDRLKPSRTLSGDLDGHAAALSALAARPIRLLGQSSGHVAMLLSGGIDSSIVCRLAEHYLGLRDTVSTSYPFESAQQDVERQYALTAAAAMGFRHRHVETTTPRYLAGLVEAIALAESPVSHLQSACMHLLVREGIDSAQQIVLQGLGAGGCVGNFRNFLFHRDRIRSRLLATAPLFQALRMASHVTGRGRVLVGKLRDMRNRTPLDDPGNPIWAWHQYGDVEWVCAHCGVSPSVIVARHVAQVQRLNAGSLYDAWALYSLLGDEEATVTIWSLIAGGSGKAFLFPFYDEDFLRYAMQIPWTVKLGGTENGVRRSMARAANVPDFVTARRKAGFGIRRDDWAVEGGPFDPLASYAADIVGPETVAALRSREPKRAMLFWNLLNYGLWKRICVDGQAVDRLCAEIASAGAGSGERG